MQAKYFVWTRHSPKVHLDGYVSATCYDPNDHPHRSETFTVHLITQDWPMAKRLIQSLRG